VAKVNVWARPLQDRERFTRTFQDIDEQTGGPKGEPFTLTLQRLTEPEESRAFENRDALVARFVGDPENGIKPELANFPPVGGKIISVTPRMCLNAAVVEIMQPKDLPEDDRYDAQELIALRAGLSEVCRNELALFINEVKRSKKKAESASDEAGPSTSAN